MTREFRGDLDNAEVKSDIPTKIFKLKDITEKMFPQLKSLRENGGQFPDFLGGVSTCPGHKGWRYHLAEDGISEDGKSAQYYCSHTTHAGGSVHIIDTAQEQKHTR